MKKLTRKNYITIIAVVIVISLTVAFSVFLPKYIKSNKEKKDLYEQEKIKIIAYGNEIGVYSLEELLKLEGVEEKEFQAVYDTSASDPVTKTYVGIEVKKVLLALNVDLSIARSITFNASDGGCKPYSPEDVIKPDNVFISYKVDGKSFNNGIQSLAHTKPQEDGGPFVVIKVSDTFSQNRCKLLSEIIVS